MFRIFAEVKKALEDFSREVQAFSTERGALERRHQDEIARLERAHEREIDLYREQLADVKALNERLLRLSGVDSLEKMERLDRPSVTEDSEPVEIKQNVGVAAIIERDKKKESTRQQQEAFLKEKARNYAKEIVSQVLAEIKPNTENGHKQQPEETIANG